MRKRMITLMTMGILSFSMLASGFGIYVLADLEDMAGTEAEVEIQSETIYNPPDEPAVIQESEESGIQETEAASIESETAASETESEIQAAVTEADTEGETASSETESVGSETAVQESETEASGSEDAAAEDAQASEFEVSESETDSEAEGIIASDLELESEEASESVTESGESESVSETEAADSDRGELDENLEDPTLHDIEEDSEVSDEIEGFTVDPSQYPAADVSENTKIIYQYLTEELGFNHAAACGVLANIQMESGFSPLALGDSGSSYGLCQWHAERFNSLISWCSANGYDYNTLTGQLAYLKHDLNTGYTNVKNYLYGVPDTAQGAYDAAYYWCIYFEAPQQAEACAQQRGNMAATEFYGLSIGTAETAEEAGEVVVEELEYIPDLEFVEDLVVEL